ncbi:MAG: Gfo/Idh/MocA family oxidoreductase [Candidatus Tectomicrobia bacterium]|uniref:Gfo/Idh/MocA family oxidoreductase n=1 Tax=Tectimicrobiota bacterium TaxID=2528274 RepID=A0A932HWT9_UNCTE|nr:Gfo/Idh/MocA family oxidoreductase [Candidatus Tectomicrobia bacterium]
MAGKRLGVGIIGSGRIGTLRAGMASAHPSVDFLAVSDKDPLRASVLAESVAAQFSSGDNLEVISRPEVNAVIVSSSEPEHALPVIQALEAGKPVLVEKPIALRLKDADAMVAASKRTGTPLHVGYSIRFQRRYIMTKDQIARGKLGRIVGGTGRLYNTRAHGVQILKRSLDATFVQDALTYLVDLFGWYLEGNRPVEVYAKSHGVVYRDLGYEADEVTWAVVTFADGASVSIGVGYALPPKYPIHGRAIRLEVLGEKGVVLLDEDHKENILYTEEGFPHAYVPGIGLEMVFLTSNASGNAALGGYWGPLGDETRAWLDHLATGKPAPHTTAEQARQTLEITLAIERSAREGKAVMLPLEDED